MLRAWGNICVDNNVSSFARAFRKSLAIYTVAKVTRYAEKSENDHTLFIPCYVHKFVPAYSDRLYKVVGSITNNYCAVSYLFPTILLLIGYETG